MEKYLKAGLFVLAVGAVAAVAGDFDAVDSTVAALDTSAKTTVKTGMTWFIAFLPLLLFAVGAVGGFLHQKKKGEQEKDVNKALLFAVGGGAAAATVGVFIDGLIGAGLMGDSSAGITVLTDFWTNLLT
jgi:Na+-transporting methylmalonyl-CoA/oxaloacetate decarboxylase gamma subunit